MPPAIDKNAARTAAMSAANTLGLSISVAEYLVGERTRICFQDTGESIETTHGDNSLADGGFLYELPRCAVAEVLDNVKISRPDLFEDGVELIDGKQVPLKRTYASTLYLRVQADGTTSWLTISEARQLKRSLSPRG